MNLQEKKMQNKNEEWTRHLRIISFIEFFSEYFISKRSVHSTKKWAQDWSRTIVTFRSQVACNCWGRWMDLYGITITWLQEYLGKKSREARFLKDNHAFEKIGTLGPAKIIYCLLLWSLTAIWSVVQNLRKIQVIGNQGAE